MGKRTFFTTTLALAAAAALTAPALAGGYCTSDCDACVEIGGLPIQTRINQAQPGDVLCLAPGTFFQTGIVINKPLTIRGTGTGFNLDGTTVSGFGDSNRIFLIQAGGAGTVIENMRIVDGGTVSEGGGIYIQNAAQVELRNIVFAQNFASTGGGAVYSQNATVIISDCEFQTNNGGSAGGGFWGNDGTVAFISGTDFLNNSTNNTGGGARFDNAVATLSDCLFDDNDTGDGGGGGITLWHADVTVDNSIFTNNMAARGPAVRSYFDDDYFTIRNCLIRSNTSTNASSGALHNNGTCFIGSCTVYGNTKGLFIEDTPLNTTIRNSIFWNNGSTEITLSGAVVRNSIIDGGYSAGAGSSNVLSFSPGFVSQPSNLRLASSSNAIDNGSSSFYSGQAVDLDGNVRAVADPNHPNTAYGESTLGPIVDIGAYEFQPPAPSMGACCTGDGSCFLQSSSDCSAAGGDYQGNGTTCNPCTPLPTPPTNDDCANALPIADGDTNYSTLLATSEGTNSCGFGPQKDIWYRYTPTSTGTLTVSTCGQADYDTRLAAYSGECGALTELACNDDACPGFLSQIEVQVSSGVPVLILVSGYSTNSSGTGTVTLTPPAPCPTDSNGDGLVNVQDLTNVILNWGVCPE